MFLLMNKISDIKDLHFAKEITLYYRNKLEKDFINTQLRDKVLPSLKVWDVLFEEKS